MGKKVATAFKPRIFYFGGRDYDYNDWYGYSRIDGWVCRSDRDCEWIDQNLGCDDREFSINLVNAPWPWKVSLLEDVVAKMASFLIKIMVPVIVLTADYLAK